jgi:hypothetical protein
LIHETEYETHDSYFYLGFEPADLKGKFFNMDRILQETMNPSHNNENSLFMM